jgi:hypothetical protein
MQVRFPSWKICICIYVYIYDLLRQKNRKTSVKYFIKESNFEAGVDLKCVCYFTPESFCSVIEEANSANSV